MSAALAGVLAAAVVLGAATDPVVLLLAVAVAQVLLAVTWATAVGTPTGRTGTVLVAATGITASVLVLTTDANRPMARVAPVLAVALLAVFVQQLLRRDGRGDLTVSLATTGTGAVLAGTGAAWLAVEASRDGTGLLLVAAAAAVLAPAADLAGGGVGAPRWVAALVAAALTGVVALVVAAQTPLDPSVALAAAGTTAVAARLGVLTANRTAAPHPVLPAVLPVLLVAPAGYVLGRVLIG